MLVIPISVGSQWFGFIGFDDVNEKRNASYEDDNRKYNSFINLDGHTLHNLRETEAKNVFDELKES